MHFAFMKELFSEYDTDIRIENGIETISIRHRQFEYPIVIHYFPDDYYTYLLIFSTQHRDTSSRDEIIAYARAFSAAEKAAIEFYENGTDRFGGEIATALLEDLTCDGLCRCYGHPKDYISKLTFTVRAWDARYCFDGHFEKSPSGEIRIVRNYV